MLSLRLLSIISCFGICLFASAQQRKATRSTRVHASAIVPKNTADVRALIEKYEWKKATTALQSLLHSAKDATTRDSLQHWLRSVQRAEEMQASTQRIVFIDSVVVNESQLLAALQLSDEAGTLLYTEQVFPQYSNSSHWSQASFVNPLKNTALFAAPYEGKQRLQSVFRTGNGWTSPAVLAGIDSLYAVPDYPFLLSDGTTLYFAAKGSESIGGYDLFVTRYNPETRQYVKPTNIGMPFNSPDNEYLYAVDPTTGIGVFATDRRQPTGKVCLYSFLVPTERQDYDSENMPFNELRDAAQIGSISKTQMGNIPAIKQALQRKQQQFKEKSSLSSATFRFVVSDHQVYRSVSDFKNAQARAIVAEWMRLSQREQELQSQCDMAELAYARQHSAQNRQQLQELKQQRSEVSKKVTALARQIRQLELMQ